MTPPRKLQVRCREIEDRDREAVLNLLGKSGFTGTRSFWIQALQRLSGRAPPAGMPRYGLLLEVNGVVVGILLMVASAVPVDGVLKVRCNVSCWYVWPAFRGYGALLVAQALKRKDVTYLNISPLRHTFDLLAAQGYQRFSEGSFLALPALSLRGLRARIAPVSADLEAGPDLSDDEIDLMIDHANYGCLVLIVHDGGSRVPFVFELSRRYRVVGTAYLVWCRDLDDFVQLAGPLGRYLAKRGFAFVAVDANGPMPGLIGRYRPATPKYFKGPDRPRLGDLAYSERAILGLRLAAQVEPEL